MERAEARIVAALVKDPEMDAVLANEESEKRQKMTTVSTFF